MNVGLDCFLLRDSEFGDKHSGLCAEAAGKRTTSAAVEADEAGSWNSPNGLGRTPEMPCTVLNMQRSQEYLWLRCT